MTGLHNEGKVSIPLDRVNSKELTCASWRPRVRVSLSPLPAPAPSLRPFDSEFKELLLLLAFFVSLLC